MKLMSGVFFFFFFPLEHEERKQNLCFKKEKKSCVQNGKEGEEWKGCKMEKWNSRPSLAVWDSPSSSTDYFFLREKAREAREIIY